MWTRKLAIKKENSTSFPGSLFFSLAPGGGKKRDPGNEVEENWHTKILTTLSFHVVVLQRTAEKCTKNHCFAHQTVCSVTVSLPSLSWFAKTSYY